MRLAEKTPENKKGKENNLANQFCNQFVILLDMGDYN
tara:strand:+ start:14863 stop:14973 length:111 start_codon:yes stop_codon:yes gene_type:complete